MIHTKSSLIIILIFVWVQIVAAVGYLDKTVTLPPSKSNLKTVFKQLSDQTGCTFSYNPLVLPDNQPVNIDGISGIKLSVALRKILPTGFTFLQNVKYIVLQKQVDKKIIKPISTKADSKIDKDLKKVALVIPVADDELYPDNYQFVKDSVALILPSPPTGVTIHTSPVDKTAKDPFYKNNIDSAEIRRIKTEYFLRKNIHLQAGISSSSPLSSAVFQAGAFGVYGIFSVSTDYNNSYRIGYGIGYNYEFENNMGLNINVERNLLFAGESYDLGVRAIITRFDPLLTYSISRDFELFIGPSLYLSESNYINANTDLGKTYGIGALIGVKIDIISALLAKK